MVNVVSARTRQTARSGVQQVQRNLSRLRQQEQRLSSPGVLRQLGTQGRAQRQQQLQNISQTVQSLEKTGSRLETISKLPTRQEAITQSKGQIQSDLKEARAAIRKGFKTETLSGRVRQLVESFRSGVALDKAISDLSALELTPTEIELKQSLPADLRNLTVEEVTSGRVSRTRAEEILKQSLPADIRELSIEEIRTGITKLPEVKPEVIRDERRREVIPARDRTLKEIIISAPLNPPQATIQALATKFEKNIADPVLNIISAPSESVEKRLEESEKILAATGEKEIFGGKPLTELSPVELKGTEIATKTRLLTNADLEKLSFGGLDELGRRTQGRVDFDTNEVIIKSTKENRPAFQERIDAEFQSVFDNLQDKVNKGFLNVEIANKQLENKTENILKRAEKDFNKKITEDTREETEKIQRDARNLIKIISKKQIVNRALTLAPINFVSGAVLSFGLNALGSIGTSLGIALAGVTAVKVPKAIKKAGEAPVATGISLGSFLAGGVVGTKIGGVAKGRTTAEIDFENVKSISRIGGKAKTKLIDQIAEFDSGFKVAKKTGKITDSTAFEIVLKDGTRFRGVEFSKLSKLLEKGKAIKGTKEFIAFELAKGKPEVILGKGVQILKDGSAETFSKVFKFRPARTRFGRFVQRRTGTGKEFSVAERAKVIKAAGGLVRKKSLIETEARVLKIENVKAGLARKLLRFEEIVRTGKKFTPSQLRDIINLGRRAQGLKPFTLSEFNKAGLATRTQAEVISILKKLKRVSQAKRLKAGVTVVEKRAVIGRAITEPLKVPKPKPKKIKVTKEKGVTIKQLENRIRALRGGLTLLEKDIPAKVKAVTLAEFRTRINRLFPKKEALLAPFKSQKVKGISTAALIKRANKLFGKRGGQLLKNELKKPGVKGLTLNQFKARMNRIFGKEPPELLKIEPPKRAIPLTREQLIKNAEKVFGKEKVELLKKELPVRIKDQAITIAQLRKNLIRLNKEAKRQRINEIKARIKGIFTKKQKGVKLSPSEDSKLSTVQKEIQRIEQLPTIVGGGGKGVSLFRGGPSATIAIAAGIRIKPPPGLGLGIRTSTGLFPLITQRDFSRLQDLQKQLVNLNLKERQQFLEAAQERAKVLERTKPLTDTRTKQLALVTQKLNLKVKQIQLQKLKLTTRTQTIKARGVSPIIRPPRIKVPPPILLLPKEGRAKKPLAPKPIFPGQAGYFAFVKELKGKTFKKINKEPATRRRAQDAAAFLIDRSLAATSRIKKADSPAKKLKLNIPQNYFDRTRAKYRPFKIVKGQKVFTPNQIIERRRFRLDSANEIQKIKAFALLARLKRQRRAVFPKLKSTFGKGGKK